MRELTFTVQVVPDEFDWAVQSCKSSPAAFVGHAVSQAIADEFDNDLPLAFTVVVNGCRIAFSYEPETQLG